MSIRLFTTNTMFSSGINKWPTAPSWHFFYIFFAFSFYIRLNFNKPNIVYERRAVAKCALHCTFHAKQFSYSFPWTHNETKSIYFYVVVERRHCLRLSFFLFLFGCRLYVASCSNSSESQPKEICFTQHRKPESQTPSTHRFAEHINLRKKKNWTINSHTFSFFWWCRSLVGRFVVSSSCALLLSSHFVCVRYSYFCVSGKLTSRSI